MQSRCLVVNLGANISLEIAQPMANDVPYVTNTITLHASVVAETRSLHPDQNPPLRSSQERNYMLWLKVRIQLIRKTQIVSHS